MAVQQAIERVFNGELWSHALLLAIAGLLYVLSNYLKVVRLCLTLPGPPALPIVGNSLLAADKEILTRYGKAAYLEYGPVFRIWLSFMPVVFVLTPPYVQQVLSSKKHTDKIFFYKLLHNFLGDGLITSSGKKWSVHRKLIQPTFHLIILEQFIDTFADSAMNLVQRLKQAPQQLNVTPFVNNCVLDILNEAVLGVPIPFTTEDETTDTVSPFRQGKVVAPYRIIRPWLLFNWIYKLTDVAASELKQKQQLFDFTRKMIDKRRTDKESGVVRERKSLLELMIDISDSNPEFTEQDIINEACTFMLAGQDSVGAALAFCLFLLAKHPDHQTKVLDEIDAVFMDSDRSPSLHDLREMRYLEQCIKETLRLYPSVPLLARKISEDITIGKHTLPAGCEVFIAPYATHRLPEIYPNPETFDPDRFLPENVERRHPYAYLPFSAGPRNCIGHKFAIMEMKTVLSTILRHYTLSPVKGKEEITVSYRITVRAHGGLWVTLNPRHPHRTMVT